MASVDVLPWGGRVLDVTARPVVYSVYRLQLLGSRGVCVLMSHAASMRYAGHDSALHVYLCGVNPLFGDSMVYNMLMLIGWMRKFNSHQCPGQLFLSVIPMTKSLINDHLCDVWLTRYQPDRVPLEGLLPVLPIPAVWRMDRLFPEVIRCFVWNIKKFHTSSRIWSNSPNLWSDSATYDSIQNWLTRPDDEYTIAKLSEPVFKSYKSY